MHLNYLCMILFQVHPQKNCHISRFVAKSLRKALYDMTSSDSRLHQRHCWHKLREKWPLDNTIADKLTLLSNTSWWITEPNFSKKWSLSNSCAYSWRQSLIQSKYALLDPTVVEQPLYTFLDLLAAFIVYVKLVHLIVSMDLSFPLVMRDKVPMSQSGHRSCNKSGVVQERRAD